VFVADGRSGLFTVFGVILKKMPIIQVVSEASAALV
jgi:hypothetical protein